MRRRGILLSIALLAALGAAASAVAQRQQRVTVLGPDAHGARVQVEGSPGHPCVRLSASNERGSGSTSCSSLPAVDPLTPFVADASVGLPDGQTALGGAVRSGVARVEYVLADGQRFAADTVAAPQVGGRLGRALRFFLLEAPAEPVTRRMFDAAGQLVDEQDDPFLGSGPPPLKGPVRLVRGRSNGARWSLYATVRNNLEPVRGDVGRRVAVICTSTSRGPSYSSGCDDAAHPSVAIDIEPGCPGR